MHGLRLTIITVDCSSPYSALTALSPLFDTLSSGVTKYYEVAFPSDGVTITLDVTQGSVTLYASDNIWDTNAQDYDWRVTANTTSGFIEAFFNSSTLNRQVRSILFLAIVGEQNTSTYIMNNAVGDIRTTGTFSLSHITKLVAIFMLVSNSRMTISCTDDCNAFRSAHAFEHCHTRYLHVAVLWFSCVLCSVRGYHIHILGMPCIEVYSLITDYLVYLPIGVIGNRSISHVANRLFITVA